VFSITDEESFKDINDFREQILRVHEKNDKIPIILVGNKVDMADKRRISSADGQARARQVNTIILAL
jgi:GTPase SAR1 family protein